MNKNASVLIAVVVSIFVLVIALIIGSKLNLTGLVTDGKYHVIVASAEIEVWAETSLEIIEDKVMLELDNGEPLRGQEIEFYTSGNLIAKEITDGKGEVNIPSSLSGVELQEQNYEIIFQGNEKEFLESSLIKKNVVNKIFEVDLTGYDCNESTESIFWSSGYSNDKSPVNYQTWHPNESCNDCFIGSLEIETRFLYFGENNQQGEGYVQISNLDKPDCNNPELGIYEKYLAYESLRGESQRNGRYCGNNKNPNSKCGIEITDNYSGSSCYGIKSYADPHFIVDVFEIKYKLCWKNE